MSLCEPCVGENVSNESTGNTVVPFKKRRYSPKCLKHSSKISKLHCEQWDCPICALWVFSFEYEQHFIIAIFLIKEKKADLGRDFKELKKYM